VKEAFLPPVKASTSSQKIRLSSSPSFISSRFRGENLDDVTRIETQRQLMQAMNQDKIKVEAHEMPF
jgi:hypothetical protein